MILARLAVATTVLASASAFAIALAFVAVGCGSDEESTDPPLPEAGAADTASRPGEDAGPERVLGPAVECTISAAIETEPNDTPQTANAFTELGFCGVLDVATDVDYFTFDTPQGTKLSVFQGVIDGKVEFLLSVDGGATFGPSETSKFGSGKYLVKAFTTAGKPASYRIRVQFDAP
jgi:hypothetical protein